MELVGGSRRAGAAMTVRLVAREPGAFGSTVAAVVQAAELAAPAASAVSVESDLPKSQAA